MKNYLELMHRIKLYGVSRGDRTGTGTKALFAEQLRFDLQAGFPLLTTKKVHFRSIIYELLWFLKGETNVRWLQDRGVTIWDEWADDKGELGPVYGSQWRSWPTFEPYTTSDYNPGEPIDQIRNVVESIRNNPNSRRHIVTAWNPAEVDNMALPPCHCLFQFFVASGRLHCHLYQRSCDYFLGVPFNIASYAFLTHMVAQQCDLDVGEFVWTGGDTHLYNNHKDQVDKQLGRTPGVLPNLRLKRANDIFSYEYEDFEILDYNPQSVIKAPISV